MIAAGALAIPLAASECPHSHVHDAPRGGCVRDLDGRSVAHAVPGSETRADAEGRYARVDRPAGAWFLELEVLPREHVPFATGAKRIDTRGADVLVLESATAPDVR